MRRKAVFLVLIILICTLASCGQKHDVALNFVPKDNVSGIASATPRPEERASITEAGNTETPEPSVDNTLEITNEAAQPSENIPTKELTTVPDTEPSETPYPDPTEAPDQEISDAPTPALTGDPDGDPADTLTPEITPGPSDTPELSPTSTPVPTPTNTPTPRPTSTPVPRPTSTPTPKPTNTPTPRPTSTPTPKPTNTLTPKPTNTPKPKPTNTPTPSPTSTPTPSPTNTPTPTPTSSPTPTENPYWSGIEFGFPGDGTAYVKSIGSYSGAKLVIPSEYMGAPVTCINSAAFVNCTQLVDVEIPDTVTQIYPRAFRGCTNLEKIKLPENLQVIESSTFEDCVKLKSITLPERVWRIAEGTFRNCKDLTGINTPSALSRIDEYAFWGCSSLKSISLPTDMYYLKKGVFRDCSSLESIVIPDGVGWIEDEAFRGCSSLKSVIIPENINTLESGIFADCTALKSVSFNNSKLSYVGKKMFEGCTSLTNVKLPDRIVYIRDSAFMNCTSLKEFVIPETVQKIESYAFSGCTGLRNVSFSDDIREIGVCAFENCDLQGEITFPAKLGRIETRAFRNNTGITAVHIPKTYLIVGTAPFEGCTGLQRSYCYPMNTEDLRALFAGFDVEMYVYDAIDRTYDDVEYDFSLLWGYGYCKYYDETLGTGNDYRTLYKRIYTGFLNYNSTVVTADLETDAYESLITLFVVGDHPGLLYASRYSTDLNGSLSLGFSKVDKCRELYPQCEASLNEIKNRIISKYGSIANASKIQRVKIIHDYIIQKKDYGASEWDQSMAGVMADDYTPVCMSYALAFKWCCNELGIQCETVVGQEAQGLHAWNIINYSDTVDYCGPNTVINADDWYEIDVTWDDPNGGSHISYRYFNLDSYTLYQLSPREWEAWYYPSYPIRDCHGTRYSYRNCVNGGLFN